MMLPPKAMACQTPFLSSVARRRSYRERALKRLGPNFWWESRPGQVVLAPNPSETSRQRKEQRELNGEKLSAATRAAAASSSAAYRPGASRRNSVRAHATRREYRHLPI